jgi:hypothetical protein
MAVIANVDGKTHVLGVARLEAFVHTDGRTVTRRHAVESGPRHTRSVQRLRLIEARLVTGPCSMVRHRSQPQYQRCTILGIRSGVEDLTGHCAERYRV